MKISLILIITKKALFLILYFDIFLKMSLKSLRWGILPGNLLVGKSFGVVVNKGTENKLSSAKVRQTVKLIQKYLKLYQVV